jgi:hypothetical protein
MINDNFCRINSALSNGILEVKFTLGLYTETSHFLEGAKELNRSYHPAVLERTKTFFLIMFFLQNFYNRAYFEQKP